MLSIENLFEGTDGVGERNIFSWCTRELFSHEERLRQELLDLTCASDSLLVVVTQLIHTKNGDDVLQILISLQHFLHRASNVVVFLSHNLRIENRRTGVERINSWINTKFSERTRK